MMPSLLLLNLALIVFAFILFKRKSNTGTRSLLKHLGLLEVAWTGFLSMLGLFILFDIMEAVADEKSFLEMASKERILQLSMSFGFGIIHMSIFVSIIFKLLNRRSV